VADKTSAQRELLKLLETEELASLGPEGRDSALSVAELEGKLEPILSGDTFTAAQKRLIRSLLLLWHDHLDESHTIAQDIHNADGSFLPGMMHRREPDYSNASYWFNRVGAHPSFSEIGSRVEAILQSPAEQMLRQQLTADGEWDPLAFVSACEAAQEDAIPKIVELMQRIQAIESRVLLERFSS